MSGLQLNLLKTMIMCTGVGDENEVYFSNLVARHHFTYTNSITHLGISIDSKLKKLDDNWIKKLTRIKNLANTFFHFAPSILCKLDICLMFFYSQLSYIGTVLIPSAEIIDNIQKIIKAAGVSVEPLEFALLTLFVNAP